MHRIDDGIAFYVRIGSRKFCAWLEWHMSFSGWWGMAFCWCSIKAALFVY